MTHPFPRIALCAALAGAAFLPATAQAWWRGGVFIGIPPVVVAPYGPGYYYPPAYPYPYAPAYYPPAYSYAPPAATAAPQAQAPQMSRANTPYGTTCYAGVYTCAAIPQTHIGSGCSCPGIGAPSYGSVQ